MKDNQEWQKLVDDYLKGQLTKTAFESLEKRLEQEPGFKAYFEERQEEAVIEGIKYVGRKNALKKN